MVNILRKNYQVPKFIVTCVKNTEGSDTIGDVPPIPSIRGHELIINNKYEARHSNITIECMSSVALHILSIKEQNYLATLLIHFVIGM